MITPAFAQGIGGAKLGSRPGGWREALERIRDATKDRGIGLRQRDFILFGHDVGFEQAALP